MCHQYTNKLDSFYPKVENAMSRIFENTELVLKYIQNHYPSSKTLFYEWLTNHCVAMYMQEHAGNDGFNLYADRETYPTFESYMPRICEFLNNIVIADNWIKILEEAKPVKPYITNIYPVDGSCLLDYDKVDAVRVTFSQPMMKAHGILEIVPSEGNIFNGRESYWEDSVTYVLPLYEDAVIKDTTYVITLDRNFFIGAKYTYRMEYNYQILYRKRGKSEL